MLQILCSLGRLIERMHYSVHRPLIRKQQLTELLMHRYPDARFYQYNVDEAEDIAQELGARQVPTFTVFKDGMVVDGVTGAKADVLERLIDGEYQGRVVED